jgi:hypothetical protein
LALDNEPRTRSIMTKNRAAKRSPAVAGLKVEVMEEQGG